MRHSANIGEGKQVPSLRQLDFTSSLKMMSSVVNSVREGKIEKKMTSEVPLARPFASSFSSLNEFSVSAIVPTDIENEQFVESENIKNEL